jgi:hypothetical protein
VLTDVVHLVEAARSVAARSVNAVMTATYWDIGRRIVEHEQGGQRRAEYGAALVERLADELTARCGRGFGKRNLFQMRAFYLAYPEIVQTPSAELAAGGGPEKAQVASAQSAPAADGQELQLQPMIAVRDAATSLVPSWGSVVRPFEAQHWNVFELLLADPDGRHLSVQAPLPSEAQKESHHG